MTRVLSMRWLLATAIVAASVAAVGCGGGSSSDSEQAGGAENNSLTKVTVVQDWPSAWLGWMPWIVADEMGWYDEAGLDVEFVNPPTPSDPAKFIASGKTDMGISYTPDLLTAAAEGLEFRAVASLMDQNVEGIMCWADSGIDSPEALKGKTVAVYDFPMAQLNWDTFLSHYGLTRDDVKTVSEGDYGVPLIVQDKVDCIDAAAPSELVDAQQQRDKEAIFWLYDTENGIPEFYWFVIAANPEFVEQNPEAARAFVEVTLRGLEWARQNPEEAVAIFAKRNPEQPEEILTPGWEQLATIAAAEETRFDSDKPEGYMDLGVWKSYQDFLHENGLIREKVNIDQLVTNDFVPGQ